jgi:CDP-glucose 4,6-dehydratase
VADGTELGWTPAPGFWSRRPVAVTGATGFAGSHLVGMLVDLGAEVVILARDGVAGTAVSQSWRHRVATVRGAVEDQAVLERMLGAYQVSTLFHLAAQTRAGPRPTFEANIAGAWSVLEAARRCPGVAQIVMAGCDRAYGDQSGPHTEDMPLLALDPFGVSKACAELVTASYARTFGLPVVTARCGAFLGPGDTNWDRLVPATVRSLLEDRRPVIRSDGAMTRDYLYVVDGALAYLQLAEALDAKPELAGEAFNFSYERPLTVLEVVEMLQIGAGTHLEPDLQPAPAPEVARQYLSAAKARRVLGWRPSHTAEEAVILTVRWYRDHLDVDDGHTRPVP